MQAGLIVSDYMTERFRRFLVAVVANYDYQYVFDASATPGKEERWKYYPDSKVVTLQDACDVHSLVRHFYYT